MFIEFKNFKILYCDDYENSLEALRCFGRQDAQQITPKLILKLKYDFQPLVLTLSNENVQIF